MWQNNSMSIKNPKSPKPVPPGFKQGSKHKSSIPSHSLIKGQQPPESPLIKGELKGVKRHLLSILLIAIIGVAIYSNTLSSAFVFDDMRNIVDNYKIRDLSNFYDLSGTRYIGFLSFALNYHFGGLNVFGYHIVNIIIHIINGLLVYYLILLTFKTPVMERTTTKIQDARFKNYCSDGFINLCKPSDTDTGSCIHSPKIYIPMHTFLSPLTCFICKGKTVIQ